MTKKGFGDELKDKLKTSKKLHDEVGKAFENYYADILEDPCTLVTEDGEIEHPKKEIEDVRDMKNPYRAELEK